MRRAARRARRQPRHRVHDEPADLMQPAPQRSPARASSTSAGTDRTLLAWLPASITSCPSATSPPIVAGIDMHGTVRTQNLKSPFLRGPNSRKQLGRP